MFGIKIYAAVLVCLSATLPVVASAEGIQIGRSTLTLPDPQRWAIRNINTKNLTYTGDVSGEIALDAKRLIFTQSGGGTKAVVLSRVTKGGVAVRMRWANQCEKPQTSPFAFQDDRSTANDVDCLFVASVNKPQNFVDTFPQLKKDLDGNIPSGSAIYVIEFSKSIGSGGYAFTQLLMSQDFKGLEGVTVDHSSQLPTSLLAWAEEFAKSNRNAVASFTGNWSIPQMSFANQ